MLMESPAFENHASIPEKYTCEGENLSPPLIFKETSAKAKSLALIVDDPDAPHGTFDHWIVWNIPIETQSLAEGAKVGVMGKNGFNVNTYKGPCPPPGKPHRYFFKLYALDVVLDLIPGSSKKQLEDAMEGHIVDKATLVGTYQRS